jgi:hypothetical protein
MPDQDEMTPADQDLEAALRDLAPAGAGSSRIDPIAAAFDAGARSQRGRVRHWRIIAGLMLVIGVGSWLIPAGSMRSPSRGGGQSGSMAFVPQSVSESSKAAPLRLSDQSLLALEHVVRKQGVGGLRPARLPRVRPLERDEWF